MGLIHRTLCIGLITSILLSTNLFVSLLKKFELENIELSEKWEKEAEEEKEEGSEDDKSDKIMTSLSGLRFHCDHSLRILCFMEMSGKVHILDILTPPPELV